MRNNEHKLDRSMQEAIIHAAVSMRAQDKSETFILDALMRLFSLDKEHAVEYYQKSLRF